MTGTGALGPSFRLRVGGPEAPVVVEVDLEEPVERGGQDLGAPELSGENYRGYGRGDDVGEGGSVSDGVVVHPEVQACLPSRVDFGLVDVPLPESSRPVLNDLRDESLAQRFEEILVGQPDDAAHGDRGIGIVMSECERASTEE